VESWSLNLRAASAPGSRSRSTKDRLTKPYSTPIQVMYCARALLPEPRHWVMIVVGHRLAGERRVGRELDIARTSSAVSMIDRAFKTKVGKKSKNKKRFSQQTWTALSSGGLLH
jgi:hypothetical protein